MIKYKALKSSIQDSNLSNDDKALIKGLIDFNGWLQQQNLEKNLTASNSESSESIVRQGHVPQLIRGFNFSEIHNRQGTSLFYQALEQGREDIVFHLLDNSNVVHDETIHDGSKALHYAVKGASPNKNIIINRILSEDPTQINIKNANGMTAATVALKVGDISSLQTLLVHGCEATNPLEAEVFNFFRSDIKQYRDLSAQALQEILRLGVIDNNISMIKESIKYGAKINFVYTYGDFKYPSGTLFEIAFNQNNIDALKLLCEYKNEESSTILTMLLDKAFNRQMHQYTIPLLIELGADVSKINCGRYTVLTKLIWQKDLKALETVLKHGSLDPFEKDMLGDSAVSKLKKSKWQDGIELFEKYYNIDYTKEDFKKNKI